MPAQGLTGEPVASVARIVPFDSSKHAGMGINTQYLATLSATQHAVMLNLPEFFYASHHYPLVFVKNDKNVLNACAITGLQAGKNLFVDEHGRWKNQAYVPASIRRLPFYTATANDPAIPDRKVIMVDEAGLSKSEDPFFDESGTSTDKWKQNEVFIADLIAAEQMTNRFTEKLSRLNLLEPFDAQINPQQLDSLRVTGMHRVNENRLNRLPAKVIQDLMQHGELSRIYAHLISLENFAKLLDLSVFKKQSGITKH